MNILIPDSWLRDYLDTPATAQEIKDHLSLCGPSVERLNKVGGEWVYDIEITGNRPDMMCVSGVAREASVILPTFGIPAKFLNDPYTSVLTEFQPDSGFSLAITTDPSVNPRFSAVVLTNVHNTQSPERIRTWLTLSGMRPINAVVDVTNYLMRAFGQPVHAFDFDQILPDSTGVPTMKLRLSTKGETIMTLDRTIHTLPGGDIVIEDGSGRLIDLCGIMGGGVSHITDESNRIVLFVQTYDASRIRRTSMALAHRTEAAALFEKGIDSELVMPTIRKGIDMLRELTGAIPASPLYDLYPQPYTPKTVEARREKITTYLGTSLTDRELENTLAPLGFGVTLGDTAIEITVPSFRRDVGSDVDIIEEIARIYGYHRIATRLPDTQPPAVLTDPILNDEHMVKHLLSGWGYTEIMPYSMISGTQMKRFGLDTSKTYTITNPLSAEWEYMRPSLLPGVLETIRQNAGFADNLKLFELSMVYEFRSGDLPHEHPMLMVGQTGTDAFFVLKGIAETLFDQFGIPFPQDTGVIPKWYDIDRSLTLGDFGLIGQVESALGQAAGIDKPVTILSLDMERITKKKQPAKTYVPVPKYPASFEDLCMVVPEKTLVGPMMEAIRRAHPLVREVTLLDRYKDTRTFHITYQSTAKNLTSQDTQKARDRILTLLSEKFQATLKTNGSERQLS